MLSFMSTAIGYILAIPYYLYRGIVYGCTATYNCSVRLHRKLTESCYHPCWLACCAPGGCVYAMKECCVDSCDGCRGRCCAGHDRGDYGTAPPQAIA